MLGNVRTIWFTVLWIKNGFIGGRPSFIKMKVLDKFSIKNATWIETGTFKGETTAFLAKSANKVFTIEPDESLHKKAKKKLAKIKNIQVVFGESEKELKKITATLDEDCNFWLDGHYSGEGTYKGTKVFPINEELIAIESLIKKGRKIAIFIDDVTFINPITTPNIEELYLNNIVNWSQKNKFSWTIENDIMILQN